MDVRQQYIDFFAKKGHKIYDSMPLVPDDASLLFTNAGMVQFKDIFTGRIPIPDPPRATSSQLCIRAGGKHNDLENVGYTARHHTLFEMLGNFSFGDYFKKDAIAYAWEFVTQELGFDKSLLYVSIHESDDEAFSLWCEHIAPERIKKMGDKDNFWQMGDTGPCGPCSEIYVDQGAEFFHSSEDYFGGEGDRFLEIWNLVFMQYEQKDGVRTPLPKPSIDTGMGLERVVALLEKKLNNFDTSLFAPLMKCIESLTNKRYYHEDELLKMPDSEHMRELKCINASFRVIADHARSVAFLLAQGVNFDKEGRGYVLRRILRRAVRHGYLLGLKKPFLFEVVECVCESMGGHYGFLLERKNAIMEQCRNEEARFFETIELGMELFNKELSCTQELFDGNVAFKLYDTYGFPLDLTQDMLRDKGIEVDLKAFESCMNAQKSRSKASWKGSGDKNKEGDFNVLLEEFGENAFVGYEKMHESSTILALLDSNFKRIDRLAEGQEGWIMLASTPFYPESGGPVGDKGTLLEGMSGDYKDTESSPACHSKEAKRPKKLTYSNQNEVFRSAQYDSNTDSQDNIKNIESIKQPNKDVLQTHNQHIIAQVLDTQKYFGLNLSYIKALKPLKRGDTITAQVDSVRLEIIKHHSATHLLHFALRKILGEHIAQAGSLVEDMRLRFDFSHPSAITRWELNRIESLVNALICAGSPQECETMNITQAKAKGAIALFGEKYGENVRVISFGDSIELCGGIHVSNTAQIGSFYIVKESGVSSGVRRIEAVCGNAAYLYGKNALREVSQAKETLKTQDLSQGITRLKQQLAELKSKAKEAKRSIKSLDFEEINGIKLIVSKLEIDTKAAKEAVDRAKNENEKVAIFLLSVIENKIAITAGVKNVPLKAGKWVKAVAQMLGGNGGGRDDFATAGGKDVSKIDEALQRAKEVAREAMK